MYCIRSPIILFFFLLHPYFHNIYIFRVHCLKYLYFVDVLFASICYLHPILLYRMLFLTRYDVQIHNALPFAMFWSIFEGFTDFLSYLTLRNIHAPQEDVIVLNSLSNLPKAIDRLKGYKEIHTYLDNDNPGKKATLTIKQTHPAVIDQSAKYADYKDLNEYLISVRQIQQKEKPKIEVKRKPFKGFRP